MMMMMMMMMKMSLLKTRCLSILMFAMMMMMMPPRIITAADVDHKIHVHPGLYPMMVNPNDKKDRHHPSSLRRRRRQQQCRRTTTSEEVNNKVASSSSSCTLHKSLYFRVGSGYLWMDGDFIGQQGTAYGGQAPFYDIEEFDDTTTPVAAQYTWYTRFMYSEGDGVGANGLHEGQVLTCMGSGTYTFEEEQEEEDPEEEEEEEEPEAADRTATTTTTTEEEEAAADAASIPTFRLLDSITWQASCANYPYFTITGGQGIYLGVKGYIETFIPTETGYRHDIYTC